MFEVILTIVAPAAQSLLDKVLRHGAIENFFAVPMSATSTR